LSLINEILDLSKVEAGRMELEVSPFDLPLAIENARTFVRERALKHGIKLDVDVDDRLGEYVGDERKIKQILLNLLSNAVKSRSAAMKMIGHKTQAIYASDAIADEGMPKYFFVSPEIVFSLKCDGFQVSTIARFDLISCVVLAAKPRNPQLSSGFQIRRTRINVR
jgi:signal transduction histidine kinase